MVRGSHASGALVASLLCLAMLSYHLTMALPVSLGNAAYAIVALPVKSTVAKSDPALEDAVLAWLNHRRMHQGLVPLRANTIIRNAARNYGLEMFGNGYLSHVSRDGRTLEDRLAAAGLQASLVGENLAYAGTLEDAERALWQSDSHRRNILYPSFRAIGVAVIDGGRDGVIVVQDFSDDPVAQGKFTPPGPASSCGQSPVSCLSLRRTGST